MKPLSETLTELGIAFTFPITIKDANGKLTYFENSNGHWAKWEFDAKTCEGKVVEVDGIKYELTAIGTLINRNIDII